MNMPGIALRGHRHIYDLCQVRYFPLSLMNCDTAP
jgi:hypothetical protein